MRSFQRCLDYCTRIRWQFLHTFADVFQGCYKNGTDGTCDYRYFAVLYLFFRIVLLASITFAGRYLWLILLLSLVVASLSFAYFHPYKNNYFNIIDCLGCGLLALAIFLIMYESTEHFPIQLLFVLFIIPLLYFISFILYKTLSRVALFRTCYSRIVDRFTTRYENQYLHIQRGDNIDEDFPHRMVNPDMYQPLLQATDSGEGNSQNDTQPQAGINSLVAYGSM